MANLNSTIINGFLIVSGKLKAKSLEIESNDLVTNLNADLLDGKQGSEYAASADLTELTTDVDNLTTQVNTNTGNILSNLEKIQENTEQIGTNKNNITSLTTRVTTDEGNISQNTTDITNLKTKTDTTNTNVSNLTTRVGTAEDDIDALETKTDTTNTNVSNLSSQVSTNATNIQTNANDISALKTKTDTTNDNVAENTRRIDEIMEGTAEIPSVADAEHANDADKLGGQLPAYYAKKTDLNSYLPLTGGTVTGLTKFLGTAADNSLMVRGIRGSNTEGTAADALYLNYGNSQPVYINGTNVAYHSGNIPSASTNQKGIVQLNNTYTSTSTTLAPTANALKSAYDTLNTNITTHTGDTDVHLSAIDRTILNKANKFKGYYETETALNEAHPTGEAGDYAIVNTTDTVWIWDIDKEGGAGWKDGAGKGSVISVNNLTGEVVLTKSNIGLGNVDNTSDRNKPVSTAQQAALDLKVNKAGDTMTGALNITDTTESTSTSTGALIISGGLAVKKRMCTNSYLSLNTDSSNSLVLGGGNNYAWIDCRQGETVVNNIVMYPDGRTMTKSFATKEGYIDAKTYLKTQSGVVNFNDKVNIEYNSTNECLDFIFN